MNRKASIAAVAAIATNCLLLFTMVPSEAVALENVAAILVKNLPSFARSWIESFCHPIIDESDL